MSHKRRFGRLPEGGDVFRYDLVNHNGMRATVLDYGASLAELWAPDADGVFDDVVLGYPSPEDYAVSDAYMGCVVGRVAGRITEGRFEADGREFALVTNDPPHHLHGGRIGFGRRPWREVSFDREHVCLEYVSPDGEEGYPGTVTARVTYRLREENELSICFQARTDQATPLSLSPHIYFNLGGLEESSIENHRVCVFAQEVVAMKPCLALADELVSVKGRPFDFNHGVRIGDAINRLRREHGDLYRIRRSRKHDLVPAARLEHPPTGRAMTVATTQEFLQFYTGRLLAGDRPGKNGRVHNRHTGLCLNPQGYPNGGPRSRLGNILLYPDETYHHQTVYAFGVHRD